MTIRLAQRDTIGVVIPCKNYETFLPRALASVRAQGLADVRVVVVDDYSANPYAVRAAAGQFDSAHRVDVLHLPGPRGIGIARNTGAAYLNTDLILFLDADDTLHEGALAALVRVLEERWGAAFAYGNYTENGTVIETLKWSDGKHLLEQQNIASYCNLWRRGEFWKIGGYRDIPVAEDWDLQKRFVKSGGFAAAHVDALIFEHVLHDANKWTRDSIAYGGLEGVTEYLANYG